MSVISRRTILAAIPLSGLSKVAVAAPGYPSRPIRIVVPNPAGGTGDVVSRMLSERAGPEIGGQFFIDNRPGGNTSIGTGFAARAEPDGYTILSITTSVLIQTLLQKLPYNIDKDFAPVIGVGSFPMALAVSIASNITTLDELKAAASSGAGLAFGSGGAGSLAHLASLRLLNEIKGRGTHVPFRGNPDSLQSMAGGYIQMMFPSASEVPTLRAAGQLRVLAVTSPERLASMPDVPTMREVGISDFDVRLWYGFLAPANVEASVVAKLQGGFDASLVDPQIKARMAPLGFAAESRGPQAFTAFMRQEADRWREVVQANKLNAMD